MKVTIIGGKGFIGRHLAMKLHDWGRNVCIPERDDPILFQKHLGTVLYCAGTTSDFRKRPFDTIQAHVSHLNSILEHASFDSLVYLSSTRIYYHNQEARVNSPIIVNPLQPDDLFNLSKLTGESICLAAPHSGIKIVRISNVCGDDFESNNFLYSIIKDAVNQGHIELHSSLDSEKDYIYIDDVVNLILKVAQYGKQRIYNVASGQNISNRYLIDLIRTRTGCTVSWIDQPETYRFPPIDTTLTTSEFSYRLRPAEEWIDYLIDLYMNRTGTQP